MPNRVNISGIVSNEADTCRKFVVPKLLMAWRGSDEMLCEILNDNLEKYAADGELQFTLPDVLKVPPISQHGNVSEIVDKFGGAEQLREAVGKLQILLYAK